MDLWKRKVIIIFVSSHKLLFFSSLHFQKKFHTNWIHFIAYNLVWQCQCNKASQERCLPLKNKTYWARYALHQRQINYIPSEEQIADILTKLLTFIHFNHFRAKLNVHPCLLNLRGAVKEAYNAYKRVAHSACVSQGSVKKASYGIC